MIECETKIGDTRVIYFKTRQEALDYAVQQTGRDELYTQISFAWLYGLLSVN